MRKKVMHSRIFGCHLERDCTEIYSMVVEFFIYNGAMENGAYHQRVWNFVPNVVFPSPLNPHPPPPKKYNLLDHCLSFLSDQDPF